MKQNLMEAMTELIKLRKECARLQQEIAEAKLYMDIMSPGLKAEMNEHATVTGWLGHLHLRIQRASGNHPGSTSNMWI